MLLLKTHVQKKLIRNLQKKHHDNFFQEKIYAVQHTSKHL